MAQKLPDIYSYSDLISLSDSLGTYILRLQDTALSKPGHPKFRLAVSGGSLPSILTYSPSALLTNPNTKWSCWEIFFADERAVPLADPDSNYGLLKKTVLDNIPDDHPQGKPTVVPIDESLLTGETGHTQDIADAYEQELIKSFAAKDSVKVPTFDLILLGCGPDGHTCSLFPGHQVLRDDNAWVAAIEDSPKPPPKRITLTLSVVTHANHIVFVATGEGKKEVLKTIFEQPEEGLPCSLVNTQGGGDKVSWVTDDKAIQGVTTGFYKGIL